MARNDAVSGEAGPGPGRIIGFWLGLLVAGGLQFMSPPEGLSPGGWVVASAALLMAIWWATEAIPIPATSLLPLVVFPATGVLSVNQAGAPYLSAIVVLLLGGFVVALALERWNLHERIALNIVARAGGKPRLLILGFMIAAALLSMWISNTATTLMMIPIAMSVARAEAGEEGLRGPFVLALLLGVAYAASVGGVATPVGTPTNLIAIGWLEQNTDRLISFPQWMALGVPSAMLIIPAIWLVLTRWAFRVDAAAPANAAQVEVRARLSALGRITMPETRVALVFGAVAFAWIVRQPAVQMSGIEHLIAINGSQIDAMIAITGALVLFMIPAGGQKGRGHRLMDWETAVKMPWGVLLLFGGGLSLAAAMRATGLAEWLGGQMAFVAQWPPLLVVVAFVAAIIFLTELTSNVATVTAFMPVLGAIAIEGGFDPLVLAAPAAIAGSCAFMLPVATAPNAIVYASGHVRMGDMIKAGFRINLISIVLITLSAGLLAQVVF